MAQTIIVSNERNLFDPNVVTFEEREDELKAIAERDAKIAQREKNSPFSRWTQFNLEHTRELIQLAVKFPKAHAILYFLVDQMDECNAVMCSNQVLQEVLGVSRQTISKNIKVLKDSGFIDILKSGNANVYAINDSVYWKTWGNRKKYSKFPANVILAMSEQDEEYQQKADIETNKFKSVSLKDKEN